MFSPNVVIKHDYQTFLRVSLMYTKIISINEAQTRRSARSTIIEKPTCVSHCAVCPKTRMIIHIGADAYIEPNRIVINDQHSRISNPMFRVLCAFNDNEGTILSRDYLLAYGWGLGNVTKNNVTVAISELRGLLSKSSDLKIITIHGKGYRMVSKNRGI